MYDKILSAHNDKLVVLWLTMKIHYNYSKVRFRIHEVFLDALIDPAKAFLPASKLRISCSIRNVVTIGGISVP